MGYFDLQVNGYAGVDFNTPGMESEKLEAVCRRLESQGVDSILATVITDTIPEMQARLRQIVALRKQSELARRVIQGIHIEGPFINPENGFRGAHPLDAVTLTDIGSMEQLLDAGDGLTRIVTLAPERDPGMKVTRLLADKGITVSAGHTNASLDELKQAVDAGLSMFTHTGNGCPATMHRHDNIVQRALSLRGQIWLCFIADGVHVPFFALKNYLALAGLEKTVIVTDAIVAADLGPGRFQFGRWDLLIGDDLVARAPDSSHFVGSTVTMPKSFENLTTHLGMSAAEARLLLEANPRRAIGLQ